MCLQVIAADGAAVMVVVMVTMRIMMRIRNEDGADAQRDRLALVEAVAHLNCLLRRGQVCRSLRADGAWLWQAV
jgi:hypothetical protein